MSATDDVARMLTLVPWLLERPGASLAETAAAFGVDERTVRRDLLDHLDFCGLPGLGGGDLFTVDLSGDRIVVSMADELQRPVRPTPAEALQLVLGLNYQEECSLREIGEVLGVTESRVCQLHAQAVHLIRARLEGMSVRQVKQVARREKEEKRRA